MKYLHLLLLLPLYLLAEPSVFDTKGIENKKVYGFSETEQYIYDNKKELDRLRNRVHTNENKINSYQSSQEGFRDLVRGNSRKIQVSSRQLTEILERLNKIDLTIKTIETQVADIGLSVEILKKEKIKQEQFNKTVQENDIQFETQIQEILKKLDEIKKTRVLKEEFKKVVKKLLAEIEANKKENSSLTNQLKYSNPALYFGKEKPSKVLSEAIKYFKKKNYDETRVRLFYLLEHTKYQRARVLYNIGELEYKQGNYKEAAKNFKASG
ncbi:MAG: hypothetical protein OIF32_05345, partial [Campylobacterales bacterium]|nr:hypothetical protein [Campylobacterales bacterium]